MTSHIMGKYICDFLHVTGRGIWPAITKRAPVEAKSSPPRRDKETECL